MHNSLESITKNGRLRELEIGSGNWRNKISKTSRKKHL